jgi:hypothetical protein
VLGCHPQAGALRVVTRQWAANIIVCVIFIILIAA